ncbi:MAG: phosphoribosyltransferase family protein [Oscillospiraceae bacterium]|nr:phosphoribosyltransferase family protein [Oscillospiraceae bacterium]
MSNTYKMTIAGLERELPLCPVSDTLDIAAFIMLGDVEITVACAEELLKKCKDFDVILTAEAKGIPLCYEMAKQSGKPYAVARKGTKVYMSDPIKVDVRSITTQHIQSLYLGQDEVNLIKGKRVLIIDDVISTGESLKALEELVRKAEGIIAGKAAVLAEGDAADRDDIIFLEKLPLFFK